MDQLRRQLVSACRTTGKETLRDSTWRYKAFKSLRPAARITRARLLLKVAHQIASTQVRPVIGLGLSLRAAREGESHPVDGSKPGFQSRWSSA
jgi:hypothetical protein